MEKVDIVVPAAGESVKDADIARWRKKSGDIVKMDEVIVELETEKASQEVRAQITGRLTINVTEGTVNVGDIIGTLEEVSSEELEKQKSSANTTETPEKSTSTSYASSHPAPSAQKLMAESQVNPQDVVGTGKDGRITKGDVLSHLETKTSSSSSETSSPQPELSKAPFSGKNEKSEENERTVRREAMTRLRRTIAGRLVNAQKTAAILTTFNEVDVSAVKAIRQQYKEEFKEKHEVGLGFMSFFTRAAAQALMEFPAVNAQVEGNDIIYHDYVDIGIAVSTPKGLVVPVVRDAHKMSFAQVEKEILQLAQKGRTGKLTMDELTGGTFSITNGGVFGSMLSTPILNHPQSAILGMHNIVERPIAIEGEVVIRPIMYVALSYDHRIIDGSESVRFLCRVKQLVEEPTRLMLNI